MWSLLYRNDALFDLDVNRAVPVGQESQWTKSTFVRAVDSQRNKQHSSNNASRLLDSDGNKTIVSQRSIAVPPRRRPGAALSLRRSSPHALVRIIWFVVVTLVDCLRLRHV